MAETPSESQIPPKIKQKGHSKSDAALNLLNIKDSNPIDKETLPHEMKRLKKENEKMAKCLEEAMEKNKKLRNELIKKRELQKKLEESQNTTKELETLIKISKNEDEDNSTESK